MPVVTLPPNYKPSKKEEKKQRPKDVFEGIVVKLTENYGFVRVEEFDKDVFVAGKFMMGTVVGDKVELRKIPSKRHQYEGEITEILEEKKNLVDVLYFLMEKFY